MNKTKHLLISISIGIIFTIVLGSVSILMAAAGHGSYLPAAVFFPGPVLTAFTIGSFSPFVLLLATVQWPVYGFIVGIVENLQPRSKLVKLMILQHVLLMVLCFVFDKNHDLDFDRLIRQFK